MKNYEITVLLSPDISDEEVKAYQQKVQTLITENAGIITETQSPLRRRLGYPIKDSAGLKKRGAYSLSLSFSMEPDKIESLDKKMKAEDEVLRSMIVYKKPITIRITPEFTPKILKETELPAKTEKIKEKKVELKEIEKKLDEILGE